jgi:hypothetical protein
MEGENDPLMMDQRKSEKGEDNDEEEAKDLSNLDLEIKDGCCNKNLTILVVVVLLISFLLIWEVVHIYVIYNNDYFGEVYYIVFLILALVLFVLLIFLFALSC